MSFGKRGRDAGGDRLPLFGQRAQAEAEKAVDAVFLLFFGEAQAHIARILGKIGGNDGGKQDLALVAAQPRGMHLPAQKFVFVADADDLGDLFGEHGAQAGEADAVAAQGVPDAPARKADGGGNGLRLERRTARRDVCDVAAMGIPFGDEQTFHNHSVCAERQNIYAASRQRGVFEKNSAHFYLET